MKQSKLRILLLIIASGFIGLMAGFYSANIYKVPLEEPAKIGSLLDAVNEEREKKGIAPLIIHPSMQKNAQLKADDMWVKNYRAHNIPGTNSIYTAEMQKTADEACSKSGENFVYDLNNGETTTEQAMEWWLNSSDHKKAILDPEYVYTGFGIAGDSVVVQHFCVPLN